MCRLQTNTFIAYSSSPSTFNKLVVEPLKELLLVIAWDKDLLTIEESSCASHDLLNTCCLLLVVCEMMCNCNTICNA